MKTRILWAGVPWLEQAYEVRFATRCNTLHRLFASRQAFAAVLATVILYKWLAADVVRADEIVLNAKVFGDALTVWHSPLRLVVLSGLAVAHHAPAGLEHSEEVLLIIRSLGGTRRGQIGDASRAL